MNDRRSTVSEAEPRGASAASLPLEFTVSVLLERGESSNGRWSEPRWEALAVVAGGQMAQAGQTGSGPVRVDESADGCERFLWSGLRLELHKDSCESYWYNLLSEQPALFIVCFSDDAAEQTEQELTPVLVTPGHDEAMAHLESDDVVFSVPMPEALHQAVERYVVAHYVPAHRKKRKRVNWHEPEANGRR